MSDTTENTETVIQKKKHKILRRNLPRIFRLMKKIHGFEVDIYKLVDFESPDIGLEDSSKLKYSESPVYSGKAVIPALNRDKYQDSYGILDMEDDDDIILYSDEDLQIPKKSLVIVKTANTMGETRLIVNNIKSIKDDDGYLYFRYYLTSDSSSNLEDISNESLFDAIVKETESINNGTILEDTSVVKDEETDNIIPEYVEDDIIFMED